MATTYVAEEVEIQFVRNRAGEQILDVQEDKQQVTTIFIVFGKYNIFYMSDLKKKQFDLSLLDI